MALLDLAHYHPTEETAHGRKRTTSPRHHRKGAWRRARKAHRRRELHRGSRRRQPRYRRAGHGVREGVQHRHSRRRCREAPHGRRRHRLSQSKGGEWRQVKRRVVVTGMGAITPVGNDVATTWRALISGESGSANITKFDATTWPVRFACEVKGFDPLQYMDRKEAKRA